MAAGLPQSSFPAGAAVAGPRAHCIRTVAAASGQVEICDDESTAASDGGGGPGRSPARPAVARANMAASLVPGGSRMVLERPTREYHPPQIFPAVAEVKAARELWQRL